MDSAQLTQSVLADHGGDFVVGDLKKPPRPESPPATTCCAPPRPPAGRVITEHDIQRVQNLVERCLQLYMSQREVETILFEHAQLERAFTGLVFERLVEQNASFFAAYFARCRVKDQVVAFNALLEAYDATRPGAWRACPPLPLPPPPPPPPPRLPHGLCLLDRRGTFLVADDMFDGVVEAGGIAPPLPTHDALHSVPRTFSLSDLGAELGAQLNDGDAGDMELQAFCAASDGAATFFDF